MLDPRRHRAVSDVAARINVAARTGAAAGARLLGRLRRAALRLFGQARRALGPAAVAAALAAGAAAVGAPVALIALSGYVLLREGPPEEETAARFEPTRDPRIVFIDTFETIDRERWIVADGWTNGWWMENDWRAGQAVTGAEGLVITLDANPAGAAKPFASGELQSRETFLYGYFEVRMRVPRGAGLVTGFFTYTRPEGRGSWSEIDFEIIGRDTRSVELTHFVEGRAVLKRVRLPFDASEGMHTYAFEWIPGRIRWYIDDIMVHEVTGPRVDTMMHEQRLYLHLWNSRQLSQWVGQLDPREAPWRLEVACVAQARAYLGRPLCPTS